MQKFFIIRKKYDHIVGRKERVHMNNQFLKPNEEMWSSSSKLFLLCFESVIDIFNGIVAV